MSIGKDALSALTGNIETAVLVIHDYRNTAKTKTEAELAKARAEAAAQALANGGVPTFPGSENKILKVQFNPSQLKLNASAPLDSKKDADTGHTRTLSQETPKLSLTTVLYFDDMDTYDAFMWEKFTSGLTLKGAANTVKGVADTVGKKKTHSVQWQVEALISALRNPYTRTISFRWADFVFIGQLYAVRANYTMFSTSGRPIRAEVMLQIQHEMDSSMLSRWYKNFETAFSGDTSNLVKVEQNFDALLNLNL